MWPSQPPAARPCGLLLTNQKPCFRFKTNWVANSAPIALARVLAIMSRNALAATSKLPSCRNRSYRCSGQCVLRGEHEGIATVRCVASPRTAGALRASARGACADLDCKRTCSAASAVAERSAGASAASAIAVGCTVEPSHLAWTLVSLPYAQPSCMTCHAPQPASWANEVSSPSSPQARPRSNRTK